MRPATAFRASRVFSGAFNDSLMGSASRDTLRGDRGNDNLSGNAGDDRLYGEAGQDTITLGAGRDQASGGPGADVFRWRSIGTIDAAVDLADVVVDFSRSGHDHLDLAR